MRALIEELQRQYNDGNRLLTMSRETPPADTSQLWDWRTRVLATLKEFFGEASQSAVNFEAARHRRVDLPPSLEDPTVIGFEDQVKLETELEVLNAAINRLKYPKLFIVHGHDEQTRLEVKNYLQNTLKLPEPIVLHEQPQQGRTLMEKFEGEAEQADGAVILLTPDDKFVPDGSEQELRRARQNVIFEMGYFYARFGRRSGRVLLLHKGKLDIPSDISGIIYIDITHGVDAAGEKIRKELGR